MQIPFALIGGIGIFFLMPTVTDSDDKAEHQTLLQKVKSIDYLGVVTLVRTFVSFFTALSMLTC